MENFDRENIDELLKICQIRQYFPPSKILRRTVIIIHKVLKLQNITMQKSGFDCGVFLCQAIN